MFDLIDGSDPYGGGGTDPPPRYLGRYRILRELGRGGMGIVYLAEDPRLGRRVAVKVLGLDPLIRPEAVSRFRREAQLLASLGHRGIISVHDVDETGGRPFLVMGLVDGPDLKEWLAARRGEGPASADLVAEILRMGAEVADALEAAHGAHIVHRDVKPGNILVDPDGAAILTDFGIARSLDATSHTVDHAPGTGGYMSPEQLRGEASERSDVFSLGVTLWEALAGERPFQPSTLTGAAAWIDAPPLCGRCPAAWPSVEAVLETAIERDPSRRYPTAARFAADLRAASQGRRTLARPRGRVRRWLRSRSPETVAMAASAFLGMVAVLTLGVVDGRGTHRVPVVLSGDAATCHTVVVQLLDEAGTLGPPVPMNGTRFALEPGTYRITAVAADGRFAEIQARFGPARDEVILDANLDSPLEVAMIEVPGGSHVARAPGSAPDSTIRVEVPSFRLDRTEVSNGDYLAFCAATGHAWPPHWPFRTEAGMWPATEGSPTATHLARHPVTMVSREDALAFVRWRGARLPTALEWEVAMRMRAGPWSGSELIAPPPVPVEPGGYVRAYLLHSHPVDEDPAAAPDAFCHGLGNVRERTASLDGGHPVTKGGSWLDPPHRIDAATTWIDRAGTRSPTTGFRGAKSVHPARVDPDGRTQIP